jgi:hypothetical protein
MIFELRTYWAAPGKIDALHNRFRSLTMGIFKRYHMDVIGFWVPQHATSETGDLIYILRFENEAAKISAWTAFQNDPEWVAGKAASEVDGVLVDHLTSTLMEATDYGAMGTQR